MSKVSLVSFRNLLCRGPGHRCRAPSASSCARSAGTSNLLGSMNVTLAAPRDNASIPSAPVPAYKSSTCAPSTSCASQLNSVSRTRPGVGLRPGLSGTGIKRPRQRPAIILIRPGFEGFDIVVTYSVQRIIFDCAQRSYPHRVHGLQFFTQIGLLRQATRATQSRQVVAEHRHWPAAGAQPR